MFMDNYSPDAHLDAVPHSVLSTFSETTCSLDYLDEIMNKLNTDEYKSILFLMMDHIGPRDFLYCVKKDQKYLKNKFLNLYYEFDSKESVLIEIFGTMQRFDLLKTLGTCKHVYQNDKETMNQISRLWKCLYSVSEQLTDSEVLYMKEKLFSGHSIRINCAEELLCHALLKNIFQENDLSRLAYAFKDLPDCFKLISCYTGASKLSYYPIRRPTKTSPCGKAIILNHVNFCPKGNKSLNFSTRTESQLDADALKKLWETFGFQTSIYTDYSAEAVFELFNSLAAIDHSSFDAFVVCYLSHGDEGIVYSSNCEKIKLLDLVEIMANRCPTLINKPKLFFIQACAGLQIQQGVGISPCSLTPISVVESEGLKLSMNTPLFCDILMVHSSFPGFVSYSSSHKNSWFIGALIHAMEEYGEELTILNVVTKVTNLVAKKTGGCAEFGYTNCKQMPVNLNTLKYELKFKKMLELTNLQGHRNH